MTPEQLAALRTELIRQRGFVRAAETQGTKILALVDAAAVVTAPEPAPTPPAPSTPTPDLHERWDYPSVEAMLANPNGWLGRADIRFGKLGLQPGALVCTFLARDPLDGQGESMVGHKIVFPPAFGRPRELWIETEITLPPAFTTNFGQDKQPDHKTISYDTDTGAGRIETKFGWGDLVKIQIERVLQERTQVGSPIDIPVARIPHTIGAPVSYRRYCTGLPIRLRAHLKVSAPATRDGAFEVWLEGEKVFQQVGIDTGSTNTTGGLTGVTFGRNLNQIPTREQWFAIGPVKIWKQNPGGFA